MKQEIKLKPIVAEFVALCYQGIQSGKEYAEAVTTTDVDELIKKDFKMICESLSIPLKRIEKRIPKATREIFNNQVKNNDSIRLDNIRSIYIRLTPAKQEMAELLMEGILKGEVEIDCTQK